MTEGRGDEEDTGGSEAMSDGPVVMLRGESAQERSSAAALADALSLPLVEQLDDEGALALAFVDDRLELRDESTRAGRGISVTFGRAHGRAVRLGSIRRQPLGRAIGEASTVLDATAGLGRDTWLLASMGYDVTAVERSPIVAALLINGLERARRSGELDQRIVGRIRIVEGDSRELIGAGVNQFDVIYIDPMFPPRRSSSALAKKSVRMLRELVGGDPDAAALLDVARRHARRRTVVKRADDAPPLADSPSFAVHGKLVRYDVYMS